MNCEDRIEQVRGIVLKYRTDDYGDLESLRWFSGKLYLTNINTPTVGFFVNGAGYGVCGPDSITNLGEIDRSKCN